MAFVLYQIVYAPEKKAGAGIYEACRITGE